MSIPRLTLDLVEGIEYYDLTPLLEKEDMELQIYVMETERVLKKAMEKINRKVPIRKSQRTILNVDWSSGIIKKKKRTELDEIVEQSERWKKQSKNPIENEEKDFPDV